MSENREQTRQLNLFKNDDIVSESITEWHEALYCKEVWKCETETDNTSVMSTCVIE